MDGWLKDLDWSNQSWDTPMSLRNPIVEKFSWTIVCITGTVWTSYLPVFAPKTTWYSCAERLEKKNLNAYGRKLNRLKIAHRQNRTYTQVAAVRTQQDERRAPPHEWRNSDNESLGLICTDTCQGWPPGFCLNVENKRSCPFPQWENGQGSGCGLTGGVVGAEEHQKSFKFSLDVHHVVQTMCVNVITSRAFLDFAEVPWCFIFLSNKTPRLFVLIWVPRM